MLQIQRAYVNPCLIEASRRGKKALRFQPPVSFFLRKHLFSVIGTPACCPGPKKQLRVLNCSLLGQLARANCVVWLTLQSFGS